MSGSDGHVGSPWVPEGKLPVTEAKTLRRPADAPDGHSVTRSPITSQEPDLAPPGRSGHLPVWTGPVHAHLGGPPQTVQLAQDAAWWWLGVHGGSGVTTLARLLPGGADAHRWWPDPRFGGPRVVILVCRTHLQGLEQARDATEQWASGAVPRDLLFAGAVAVADSPRRPGRAQAESLRLLKAAVPRVWSLPWLEELRALTAHDPIPLPPALLPLASDLKALAVTLARRQG